MQSISIGAICTVALPLAIVAGLSLRSTTSSKSGPNEPIGSAVATSDSSDSYASVAHLIERRDFQRLPRHLQALLISAAQNPTPGSAACCFTGVMPAAFVDAFNRATQGADDFQLTTRWAATAASPGPLGQGDPTTITYSFVPDGVSVPGSGIGATAPNDLNATFDALFGSRAAWQAQFAAAFARWSELTGITYIFEPNDDGAPLFNTGGVLGVRGDVRISGRSIDGQTGGNVLAFNNFPQSGGDMVLDTDNTSLWGNPSGNFRLLRNTIMHEHGHGIGMLHVCPANQTKLMEPFISSAYDGPQFDDVLGANRAYGDRFENNNTSGTATDLGTLANGRYTQSNLSIDDNSDVDWFRFTVTQPKAVAVTLRPLGSSYLQGPQTTACDTGATFDPVTRHDLGFEVLAQNGTTSLISVDQLGLGATEVLPAFPLLGGPGTYFLRVFGSATNDVQLYEAVLDITTFVPPAFTIDFPNGTPASLSADSVTMVDVRTINTTGAPDPATATLFASIDGGPYVSSALEDVGGGLFQAALPAADALSEIDWYVSIAPLGGGAPIVAPFGAPGSARNSVAVVTFLLTDNFNTNLGWTVSNDPALTDGAWERGIPVGGGTRGDPASDSDGSGFAFLTANRAGNSDVDGGATRLTSPVIDLSQVGDALVRFDFWYDNAFGTAPNQDVFTIEMNTGAGFVVLENYNASVGQWVTREFAVPAAASTLQMRFTASDLGTGSVVEAGLDAFAVLSAPTLPTLDANCAAGNVGGVVPESVLLVGGTDGQTGRRVVASAGQKVVLEMLAPTAAVGSAPFAIFFQFGVPGPADLLPVAGIGTLCVGGGLANGPLVAGVAAPWRVVTNGVGGPLEFTLQGVILETAGVIRVTNAVVLDVR